MEESSELSPPFTSPPFTSGADTSITDVEVVHIDAAVTTAALTPIIIQNVAQSFREPESRIVQDVEFQNDSECVDGVEEEVGMVVQSVEASDPSIHGLELRMGNDGQVFMAACLICGDRASGYHYSVLSCEGCKGFFKRTVQKNLMYTCKDAGKGSCVVNKSTRNNCQFCRYNKCLQHGMRRDAVREDRSPGGKHRVKRPRLEDIGVVDLNKKMEDVHLELIEKLMEAHPDRIPGSTSDKSGDELTIEELMQYGYVELRFIIEWAKQIPYFRDFGLDDQMAMLKSSFMELNVLRLSYRSVAYDNRIKFAEGLVIPVSTVEKMGWGFELVQSTVDFAARLKELNMDHAEFCIMCAIVLTYPDAIGIVDKMKVTSIQTRYLDVLRRYIYSKYPHSTSRYGKLLLRLPTLRTLSAKAAERFLSLTLEGVLHINDLVQEMIN